MLYSVTATVYVDIYLPHLLQHSMPSYELFHQIVIQNVQVSSLHRLVSPFLFRPRETVHLAAELPPPATDKEYTGQVKLGGKPVKDLGASGPSKRHPWDPYDSTKSLREWLGVGSWG